MSSDNYEIPKEIEDCAVGQSNDSEIDILKDIVERKDEFIKHKANVAKMAVKEQDQTINELSTSVAILTKRQDEIICESLDRINEFKARCDIDKITNVIDKYEEKVEGRYDTTDLAEAVVEYILGKSEV